MTPHQILALLPHAFQASEEQSESPTALATLLSVMEVMHVPTESILDRYTELFAVSTAPERHHALLGSWCTERYLGSIDATCERELLQQLGTLQGLRGTPGSLLQTLRLVTGCNTITISDTTRIPFHIAVRAPTSLRTHAALISAVLDEHKPAHITYELSFF